MTIQRRGVLPGENIRIQGERIYLRGVNAIDEAFMLT